MRRSGAVTKDGDKREGRDRVFKDGCAHSEAQTNSFPSLVYVLKAIKNEADETDQTGVPCNCFPSHHSLHSHLSILLNLPLLVYNKMAERRSALELVHRPKVSILHLITIYADDSLSDRSSPGSHTKILDRLLKSPISRSRGRF
jgi:hypothetical protein